MNWLLRICCGICAGYAGQAFPEPFTLPTGCKIPWEDIAVERGVSKKCGITGAAKGNSTGAQQNRMKNNLCANNAPISLAYTDFRNMQRLADQRQKKEQDFNFGGHTPIKNRKKLRNFYKTAAGVVVGEGMVVRHPGFLVEARDARIGTSGEGKLENDIHIDIARRPGDNPCLSVTAEMIPHFRPDAWTPRNLNRVRDRRLPVRVTGHLFFDSSHVPCDGTKGPGTGHPLRVSLWEIHPVYKFEVCRNSKKAECPEDDDSVWQQLHEWVADNPA